MSDTSSYPLRLPKSLKENVAKVAKHDSASINQFIAIAVAEKISALETEKFFAKRAKNEDIEAFWTIIYRPGGGPPRPGDELG
jgi:hypothetical protein